MKKIFDNSCFLGYVNQVSPQGIKIHFPSSVLLNDFRHEGTFFNGANVGNFVVIEGVQYGFLARIIELSLPDSERKSIDEKSIHESDSIFHPLASAELLLSFNLFFPNKLEKTIAHFPHIGAKVFACSVEQLGKYIKTFGYQEDEEKNVYAELGVLTTLGLPCNVSINSIFNRHCAVVGTTGGGKSWTVARLIESVKNQTTNKVILIDATGEYCDIADENFTLAVNACFPYRQLTISDLFYLLRPTGQSQRPILLEAIRSLKLVELARLDTSHPDETGKLLIQDGCLIKEKQLKQPIKRYTYRQRGRLNDNLCSFNIHSLINQIRNECIYQGDEMRYAYFNQKDYDYQTSLICRIGELLSNQLFSRLLGLSGDNDLSPITQSIETFLLSDKNILRICFAQIPSAFSAKEIISNAIASFLLNLARNGKFVNNPIVVFVDEAHQFLNKNISDDFFSTQPLDAFDAIAKECRKYGLFLCLSTQMPRDIPIGTLSQVGTFIVHRLINDQDRKTIESACSSANRASLSLLPALGAGEALLLGVDFPMPLVLKIKTPTNRPNSRTPALVHRKK